MSSARYRRRERRAREVRILDRPDRTYEVTRVNLYGPPETIVPLDKRPGIARRAFWRLAWALKGLAR